MPFVCVIYTKSKIISGPTIRSSVLMLLHFQILLALLCIVGLGWRGYTPTLSLLVCRNFFLGFESIHHHHHPLFVTALKKNFLCISALRDIFKCKDFSEDIE